MEAVPGAHALRDEDRLFSVYLADGEYTASWVHLLLRLVVLIPRFARFYPLHADNLPGTWISLWDEQFTAGRNSQSVERNVFPVCVKMRSRRLRTLPEHPGFRVYRRNGSGLFLSLEVRVRNAEYPVHIGDVELFSGCHVETIAAGAVGKRGPYHKGGIVIRSEA